MRDIFKPIIVLFAVCVVVTFCVAFIFNQTKDVIAERQARENEIAMNEVLPNGAPYEEITEVLKEKVQPENDSIELNNAYAAANGYVFNMSTQGYGGEVVVIIGINDEGKVNNIQLGSNNETPSIGKKAEEESFTSRFSSVSTKADISEEVDAIGGATITSTAVFEAVSEACYYYNSYIETAEEGKE